MCCICVQEREYQRRLRQLEMREKELEFQRSMKSAEEKETLELSRKSLAKELDLLDESQTALLRTYARDITPKAVQEERVVPDHVSGHAIPCLLAYAQQLRSASSASPSHMPRPPAKQTPEATYRRPSNNAGMYVARVCASVCLSVSRTLACACVFTYARIACRSMPVCLSLCLFVSLCPWLVWLLAHGTVFLWGGFLACCLITLFTHRPYTCTYIWTYTYIKHGMRRLWERGLWGLGVYSLQQQQQPQRQ